MSKKRIMSALGATLIASATLAATVGPAATAATSSTADQSVATAAPTSSPDATAPAASIPSPAATSAPTTSTPTSSPKATADPFVTAQDDWVSLHGTASEDGVVIVTDHDGTRVGVPVEVVDGKWSMTIPETLTPGPHNLTVRLYVDDVFTASTTHSLFWAQPINAIGPSGPIIDSIATLSGIGRDTARIIISENGVTVAETTVSQGVWTVPVSDISVGVHRYTVLHLLGSAGTYDSVTVVREAASGAPLAVGSPTDPSVGYTPNTAFTFTGSAPASAKTVTIRNAQGTLLAIVPIDQDTETWSWTRSNMGTSIYKLTFIAGEGTSGEKRLVLGNFGPKAQVPVDRPVIFTNPTDPSLGYEANTSFTFRGTATPGALVTLTNAQGTAIAQGLAVDKDGNWSWTRANMGTSTWRITAVATTSTGTQRATLAAFAPAAPQADRPLAFTNPVDPAAGYVANTAFTFRGTAPQGTSVSLRNFTGLVVANDLAVDKDGNWSWTRANMGTSIWKLTAVARFADGSEKTTTLAAFAPAK